MCSTEEKRAVQGGIEKGHKDGIAVLGGQAPEAGTRLVKKQTTTKPGQGESLEEGTDRPQGVWGSTEVRQPLGSQALVSECVRRVTTFKLKDPEGVWSHRRRWPSW